MWNQTLIFRTCTDSEIENVQNAEIEISDQEHGNSNSANEITNETNNRSDLPIGNEEAEAENNRDNMDEGTEDSRPGSRQYCGPIKVKGRVDKIKQQGIARLFAVNFNGFGPKQGIQAVKVHELSAEIKKKNLDGILISSFDIR